MRKPHVYQLGVHALDIGQHQQLLEAGIVAHVAVHFGVGITPLFGGLAEKSDIK